MKRTASTPTSSTTSRRVTKSPDRLDIFTGAPPRNRFTIEDYSVQVGLAATDRVDRGLHSLDVTAMIGAPDVDHVAEATFKLRFVIRNIGSEVSIAAIRLL